MKPISFFCLVIVSTVIASPLERDVVSPYVPQRVSCPSRPITRVAKDTADISTKERSYIDARTTNAESALKAWLDGVEQKTGQKFDKTNRLPMLAMAISGGGDRSLLSGGGVIQAFDNREEHHTPMSGLFQSLVYQSALSGGNELLGGLTRLNWPTISNIMSTLWDNTLVHARLYPGGTKAKSKPIYEQIKSELERKAKAGFKVSLADVFGRLYAFSFLGPPDGSVEFKMSDVALQSNFTRHLVPYPIHISTNVAEYGLACPPILTNNSQFELTPYEFGSWDTGISSFVEMQYLGSTTHAKNTTCVTGFDNQGFLMASSGDAAGLECLTAAQIQAINQKLNGTFNFTEQTLRAQYPNPFYQSIDAPAIKDFDYLQMVDGGGADMGVAVWPLIHRPWIDVIFSSDNTNSTVGTTNGSELYNTYTEAKRVGLTRMPEVPTPEVFVQKGYNKRNVFFGCNDAKTASLVYMPLVDYTFNSTGLKSTLQSNESVPVIHGAVENGNAVGTFNGKSNWPLCVACLVMKKTNTTLPSGCTACFEEYCVT